MPKTVRKYRRKRGGCACQGGKMRKRGKGIINDLISSNALPELHLRGFSGKYNFAGPFTKLDKRLDKNKKPHKWSQPINDVDKSAYHHDLCYGKFTSTKDRNNICDKIMLDDLRDVIKHDKDWKVRADARVVKAIIGSKKFLGLGKRKKYIRI